jgi:hypothetical protein
MAFRAPIPRRALAVAAAVVALYALLLAHYAIKVATAPSQRPLATWLVDHHLHVGLSDYYAAALISVDAGDQVTIAPVRRIGDRLVLSPWESTTAWYDPSRQDANFFVATHLQGCPADDASLWARAAIRAYGPAARTYPVDGDEVLVWDRNLLDTPLERLPVARPSAC